MRTESNILFQVGIGIRYIYLRYVHLVSYGRVCCIKICLFSKEKDTSASKKFVCLNIYF